MNSGVNQCRRRWRGNCNLLGRSASAPTEKIMINVLRKMWHDDEGQDLAEYGLLLILICVAVVGVVVAFRTQIEAVFTSATTSLKTP
jgi:Flp pilus assembly pilin Flp